MVMMGLNDIKRLLAPLQRKIFLMIGRAILTAVDNSTTTQLIQMTVLDGETLDDVERFQEYGLETYPFTGAEALAVFLNGKRVRGAVICIMDRQYRPDDLSEGEVAMYTDEDSSGHRVWLKRGNIIELIGGAGTIGGVITDQSLDPFTGSPHIDASTTIKASK